MGENFAIKPLSNSIVLCVGEITRAEAERAREDGHQIDGSGFYLFLANGAMPKSPIHILAKFLSPSEAISLARVLRTQTDFE